MSSRPKRKDPVSNTEILEVVAQTELLRILECPVCKDVPFPPIFNCNKGHIICNQCQPKLSCCPLCKSPLSGARNFAVESIIMSSKHTCKYKEFGCNVVLLGDVMSTHVQNCQYGGLQVKCHIGKYRKNCTCKIKMFPIQKYLYHLKETHMILRSISKAPLIVFESPMLTDMNDTFWLGDYQIYDGETFLVRQFVSNKLIYFSLAVIADEEVAKKYFTTIKISSKTNKVYKITWSVPVHSIQNTEENIKETCCGVSPLPNIMNLSQIVHSDGKEKMIFQVEYTIMVLQHSSGH